MMLTWARMYMHIFLQIVLLQYASKFPLAQVLAMQALQAFCLDCKGMAYPKLR